jgi:hypothetical protein
MVIRGLAVVPAGGVIAAPGGIAAALAEAGLTDNLAHCRAELERIQDDFLTKMPHAA